MGFTFILFFVGGLFIFLYGMSLARKGLEKASGEKLRSYINHLIKDRLRSFLTGVLSTFIMESSGAATVMFVGFASAGVLDLFQSVALSAGATVGTTLFVLLLAHFISYDLTNFSLVLIILGYLMTVIRKKGTVRYLGDAVIGFGVLVMGICFMIKSVSMVSGAEFFRNNIGGFAENPLMGIMFSAVFTAIIHSSAGTIGIALSLTTLNLINIEAALPIVIGANIGTCFTAILASLDSPVTGKRVAWAHLMMKIFGTIVFLPLIGFYGGLIGNVTQNINYQVALFHFIFNLVTSLLVLLGLRYFVKLVERLVPEKEETPGKFKVKFLDEGALATPSVAFGNVVREIMRMADINQELLALSIGAFEKNDMSVVERLEDMDDHIDTLNQGIKFYLAKVSQEELTQVQSKREMDLINTTNNLEIIGDIITKTMMELAVKKIKKGFEFSKEGWQDIKTFHEKVLENFHIAVTSFASNDVELARKAIRNKTKIGELEEELKQAHFRRLTHDIKESYLTSSIHLEILGHLRRVNSYVTKIAFAVLEQ